MGIFTPKPLTLLYEYLSCFSFWAKNQCSDLLTCVQVWAEPVKGFRSACFTIFNTPGFRQTFMRFRYFSVWWFTLVEPRKTYLPPGKCLFSENVHLNRFTLPRSFRVVWKIRLTALPKLLWDVVVSVVSSLSELIHENSVFSFISQTSRDKKNITKFLIRSWLSQEPPGKHLARIR